LGQGHGQARSRTQITCSGAVRAATQAKGCRTYRRVGARSPEPRDHSVWCAL